MSNILQSMSMYGDGEEEKGTFDHEKFFSIGDGNTPMADNPFAPANLAEVGKELEIAEQGLAQEVNLGANQSILTEEAPKPGATPQEIYVPNTHETLPERTVSTNNRFQSFESTIEPESVKIEIDIGTEQPHIEQRVTEQQQKEQEEPIDQSLLEMERIAKRVDPVALLEQDNGNKVESKVLTGDIMFQIDDEPEDQIDGAEDFGGLIYQPQNQQNQAPQQQETYHQESSYLNEPQYTDEPQYTNEPPYQESQFINEPIQRETMTQEPNQSTQYQQSAPPQHTPSNRLNLPTFQTNLGIKYKEPTTLTVKPEMLNLSNFNNGKPVCADAYLEKATVHLYQDVKKRVEYHFIIANGIKLKASKFDAPRELTNKDVATLAGKVYKVEGKWNTYQRKEGLVVDLLAQTNDTTVEDFLPTKGNSETYLGWYYSLLETVKEPWVKNLINGLMIGDNYLDKMRAAPASLYNHDSGKGELFNHVVKVTLLSYQTALLYPTVNSDVVVASGLLHDIGKIIEIGESTYTDLGITAGHIPLGYAIVREKLQELKQQGVIIDDRVAQNILHCILAHHGKLEYGSPVVPKTREAFVVHLSDMMDTHITNIDETLLGQGSRAKSGMLKYDVLDLNTL